MLSFASSPFAHMWNGTKERRHGKNLPLLVIEALVAQQRHSKHPTKHGISLLLELFCFLDNAVALSHLRSSVCFCSPISHRGKGKLLHFFKCSIKELFIRQLVSIQQQTSFLAIL